MKHTVKFSSSNKLQIGDPFIRPTSNFTYIMTLGGKYNKLNNKKKSTKVTCNSHLVTFKHLPSLKAAVKKKSFSFSPFFNSSLL